LTWPADVSGLSVGGRCQQSLGGSLAFSRDLLVERVETLGLGAIEVEPPVADEVVLVEDGAVGAEEGVLGETALTVACTDVEDLVMV